MNSILIGSVSIFAVMAAYYWCLVAKRPRVYVQNRLMKKFMNSHIPILKETYWPSIFYWEGRLQTYFGLTKRHTIPHRLHFKREILPLSDGGELALDTMEPIPTKSIVETPVVVLLLPGVGSSSRTSYIRTLVTAIQNAGATTVVFNNRGFAGLRLKTPRTHSARNVEDIREVITHLKNLYPYHKLVAIGTSLGGIVLCHYLIDHPEEASEVFTSVILLSTVWDYYGAVLNLEKSFFNREVINKGLTKDLVYRVIREKEMFETRKGCWDFKAIEACKSARDFDTTFHVPQWGYSSIEEYLIHATLLGKTHKFSVPVFSLNAYDDPMMPGQNLPIGEALAADSNLALIVTNRGGHLGFLEGILPKSKEEHYMERFTTQFILALSYNSAQLFTQ